MYFIRLFIFTNIGGQLTTLFTNENDCAPPNDGEDRKSVKPSLNCPVHNLLSHHFIY